MFFDPWMTLLGIRLFFNFPTCYSFKMNSFICKSVFLLLLIFGLTKAQVVNSLETIINDMTLPHEDKAAGVPESYDWASGPRIGRGNEPGDFKAFIAWGQVYEAASGNPAKNTRVELKNIKAYILSKADGKWHLLQSSTDVEGAAYREDFVNDESKTLELRTEPDGSISVTAGDGYNFHFWTSSGRSTIDPDDVAGVFTTVQARLIVDDPTLPDDRATAKYLLSMGGDYWLSLSAQWKSDWSANGDAAIGRFKYVTSEWQAFNMTTLSEEELRNNPPPLE
jgi:hypothetical protein